MDIKSTDALFHTDGCGRWTAYKDLGAPKATIPPGMWAVKGQIQTGRFQAPGGANCYWERLSGFSGEFDQIIANGGFTPSPIVDISATDLGFSSSGCGTWKKIA